MTYMRTAETRIHGVVELSQKTRNVVDKSMSVDCWITTISVKCDDGSMHDFVLYTKGPMHVDPEAQSIGPESAVVITEGV